MIRILSVVVLVFMSATILAQRTKYVVLVVLDGARYSETFGDPTHQYIPKIWANLRPNGAIYTSYRNDGLTETNPGHSSIVTGTWQYIANDGSVRPHAPTMFEYYRKARGTTAEENYVILGKQKLDILTYSDNVEYGSTYKASVIYSASQYNDAIALDNLRNVITNYHPRLMVVNLPGTDNAGHSGVWNNYVRTLWNADSLINEAWNYVQADSVLRGKTTMILSNDHGRHLDNAGGFANHGDGCEGCRHIMLMVVGPDTPAGIVDSTSWKQTDVAPTVGALLGFPTTYAIGKVISSAVVTGVKSFASGLPDRMDLLQNYPNPFNPSTTIRYELPRASHVTLKIFNTPGQEVAVLVNNYLLEGGYSVTWDAGGLASGVYVYRLQAGNSVLSRKLLLLR